MKQLYGKLWAKCTAIALLVVFAVLFAAAALGSAYLIRYGAFADGGEQVRQMAENNLLQQTRGDGWTAMHAWAEDDTVTGDLLRERYDPLTSNIYFKLTDKDTGEILFSTGKMPKDDYTGKASAYYQQDMTISLRDGSDVTALYQAYLKSPLAPRDSALYVMTWVERLINARYLLIVLAVFLLAVCLFLFIFLLCSMGRKEGVDGIYQCWLNKIPLDLFLALLFALFFAWAAFLSDIWYIDFWYYILLAFGAAALALTLVLSVAGRAKAPGFFRNTVIYKLFLLIFRTLGRIPMVWRTMLIWVCWCFVDLYFTFSNSYYYDSLLPAFWVISRAVLTIVILYLASSLRLLQKEGQAIADGQTDYKGKPIPRWLPALKKHEENLQSIQSGIQKAVDEQMRAERMKTELITNVSHDIKTPLTSIVNYIDLLEKEDIQPEKAKEYEQQTGIKVNLEIMDPKGNQNTQNSQVDRFLSLEYDAICVNMVDRSAASYVINKAMDAGTPVVFFNREPVEEDMKRWEHLYYVGEDARESAVLQGELLVDAYQKNPGSLDLNEDGTVGYVMLEGERSHQDSLIRTEWSVQTMRNGDIPLEKLTGGSANWDRSQAAALMEQWIRQFGDAIEVVICNNDEMALGAAEALERAGDTRGVKVVGIDGTPQGIEGLKSGKLYGTVQCDSDEYAEVIFEIAAAEALGQNVQEKVELEDGTYYQCSQKALTVADLP